MAVPAGVTDDKAGPESQARRAAREGRAGARRPAPRSARIPDAVKPEPPLRGRALVSRGRAPGLQGRQGGVCVCSSVRS